MKAACCSSVSAAEEATPKSQPCATPQNRSGERDDICVAKTLPKEPPESLASDEITTQENPRESDAYGALANELSAQEQKNKPVDYVFLGSETDPLGVSLHENGPSAKVLQDKTDTNVAKERQTTEPAAQEAPPQNRDNKNSENISGKKTSSKATGKKQRKVEHFVQMDLFDF